MQRKNQNKDNYYKYIIISYDYYYKKTISNSLKITYLYIIDLFAGCVQKKLKKPAFKLFWLKFNQYHFL